LNLPPKKLTSQRPYLPLGLQEVIERCLEKNRDDRYQNVAELVQELRPFAPPHTHARIEHVVRVIREAGENVRPPTPMPGASGVRAIEQIETLAAGEARSLLTTGSGAGSWGRTNAGASRRRWSATRIAGAAAVVVGVVGLVAVLRAGGDSQTAASANVGVALAVTIPSQPALPTVAAAPEPAASAATSAPDPPRAPFAAVGPLHKRTNAKDSKPSPSSSAAPKRAPSAPTFDPTGVIDPFQ
jgi:serine/threonine-protein kinase